MATNGISQPPVDISVAISPNNIEAVPSLVKQINAGIENLPSGGSAARHDLLLKARSLVQALETPRETMIKHCWGQTAADAGILFGIDTGLWTLMAKNGDKPQKVTDLAANTNVDPILLGRLLRHLGAMGYLIETNEDEYIPTNFIKSLSIPIIADGYPAVLTGTSAGALEFTEFARKRGYKNPTDAKDTSLMAAYNTDKDMFAHLQELGYGVHFNHHMGGYSQGRLSWMAPGFYPVKENLIDGAENNPDAPFLVDVGGSVGHDLMEFQKYYPQHPGKLVLQDLPVVIGQISNLDSAITAMGHDFLTEQPIKGARAYYMHSVLHDWPNEVGKIILEQLKAAMKPGYSKLLINENVVPSTGAYWETTALDVQMMALFGAGERTQRQWHHLLEEIGGFKIIKIWTGDKGAESLIECELPA